MAKTLATAYFVEARNIGDVNILAEIAANHGFDMAEAKQWVLSPTELNITRQAVAAAARGIRSVPHFVFNATVILDGHQDKESFVKTIRRAMGSALLRDYQ